jgi:hypothetical protein
VPKSRNTLEDTLPVMTMEAVANHGNLICAFEEVAQNRGASGPDGRSIDEVRTHLGELLPVLRRSLLDGTYRPGMIRRVWIPKTGGGERGLGIPDVVDRWVQQAVHRVLSPHWEPSFHASSHGFRPGRSCHTAIQYASMYDCRHNRARIYHVNERALGEKARFSAAIDISFGFSRRHFGERFMSEFGIAPNLGLVFAQPGGFAAAVGRYGVPLFWFSQAMRIAGCVAGAARNPRPAAPSFS